MRSSKNSRHVMIDGTYEIGCKLERKRVECALMVKAALALEGETENEEA